MKNIISFKNIITLVLFSSITSFLLTSCKVPASIPENKLKVIVWDLMKGSYDSTTSTFKFTGKFTDEDLAPLEEVFKINKVTREDFYYTFETYQQDPAKFKLLIDSVIAYGSRENNKVIIAPESKPKQTQKSNLLKNVKE